MVVVAERELERSYPWIPWREPLMVNDRWACRYCIAMYGLHGSDVGKLWLTPPEVQQHLAEFHPE